jgi:Spy/CpxP family protein refolding chaperone
MTPPLSPSRKRPSGPFLAILVLALTLVVGALAGVALDRHVLLPRRFHGGPLHEAGRRPPRDREFRNRFARELGLTDEQRQRIDSIMDRQGRELRAVRQTVQPQLDSIIARTRRQLDSVLTPEQRKKAEEIRRQHPRRAGPPPDESHPPPPEGPPPEPRQ